MSLTVYLQAPELSPLDSSSICIIWVLLSSCLVVNTLLFLLVLLWNNGILCFYSEVFLFSKTQLKYIHLLISLGNLPTHALSLSPYWSADKWFSKDLRYCYKSSVIYFITIIINVSGQMRTLTYHFFPLQYFKDSLTTLLIIFYEIYKLFEENLILILYHGQSPVKTSWMLWIQIYWFSLCLCSAHASWLNQILFIYDVNYRGSGARLATRLYLMYTDVWSKQNVLWLEKALIYWLKCNCK